MSFFGSPGSFTSTSFYIFDGLSTLIDSSVFIGYSALASSFTYIDPFAPAGFVSGLPHLLTLYLAISCPIL